MATEITGTTALIPTIGTSSGIISRPTPVPASPPTTELA
jgi:hypothetical protein